MLMHKHTYNLKYYPSCTATRNMYKFGKVWPMTRCRVLLIMTLTSYQERTLLTYTSQQKKNNDKPKFDTHQLSNENNSLTVTSNQVCSPSDAILNLTQIRIWTENACIFYCPESANNVAGATISYTPSLPLLSLVGISCVCPLTNIDNCTHDSTTFLEPHDALYLRENLWFLPCNEIHSMRGTRSDILSAIQKHVADTSQRLDPVLFLLDHVLCFSGLKACFWPISTRGEKRGRLKEGQAQMVDSFDSNVFCYFIWFYCTNSKLTVMTERREKKKSPILKLESVIIQETTLYFWVKTEVN